LSAARAIDWCRQRGVWVSLDGDNVTIRRADRLTQKQLDSLRENKSKLVEELRLEQAREAKAVADQAARFNDPSPSPAWWTQPVEGWRDGVLPIRNIVTDKTTIIDIKRRSKR
jgi:hypothetical protein